jgi:hypothetical protein
MMESRGFADDQVLLFAVVESQPARSAGAVYRAGCTG